MLTVSKLTPKQIVMRYAFQHNLSVKGSDAKGYVTVMDKEGHWSEAWTLTAATWAEMAAELRQIQDAYFDSLTYPWQVARLTYTGKMKPQTKVA